MKINKSDFGADDEADRLKKIQILSFSMLLTENTDDGLITI